MTGIFCATKLEWASVCTVTFTLQSGVLSPFWDRYFRQRFSRQRPLSDLARTFSASVSWYSFHDREVVHDRTGKLNYSRYQQR